ncbi:4a-hydroxytetrahydrobiopterin dehydratase [filamentous cyanobacterium CCP5]|nr:4a-hydroxytetrahydrobiopterin dehydratase [filamentous cyanobacterium CCT1]PSN19669.1 4a-hydroxytetrahydrobiopterin dehydratase [filamentous cyanobacterium CCP5]
MGLLWGVGQFLIGVPSALAEGLEPLSADQVAEQMESLSGWRRDGQQIFCTYRFEDFVASVDFVNQLVAPAEAAAHHPDLAIAYNQVTVRLTTHDAGGLTAQDFALARTVEPIAAALAVVPTCLTD